MHARAYDEGTGWYPEFPEFNRKSNFLKAHLDQN